MLQLFKSLFTMSVLLSMQGYAANSHRQLMTVQDVIQAISPDLKWPQLIVTNNNNYVILVTKTSNSEFRLVHYSPNPTYPFRVSTWRPVSLQHIEYAVSLKPVKPKRNFSRNMSSAYDDSGSWGVVGSVSFGSYDHAEDMAEYKAEMTAHIILEKFFDIVKEDKNFNVGKISTYYIKGGSLFDSPATTLSNRLSNKS